jgi:hypothetical protein
VIEMEGTVTNDARAVRRMQTVRWQFPTLPTFRSRRFLDEMPFCNNYYLGCARKLTFADALLASGEVWSQASNSSIFD